MTIDSQTYLSELADAAALKELSLGHGVAAMLAAVTELGVADHVGSDPVAVEDLAAKVGAEPETLHRVLRCLVRHGVFENAGERAYRHSATSVLLREDHPRSVRYQVLWMTTPWAWATWPTVTQALRTGRQTFDELYGKPFFRYLAEDAPEAAAIFDRAMTQSSTYTSHLVAGCLDLAGVATVVDVGGGQGNLLLEVMRRNLGVGGILFDLPGVVADPRPELLSPPLADRVRLIGGDCVRDAAPSADAYLVKNLLEWDDDRSVRTLENIRAAALPGARTYVVQNLVDDEIEPRITTIMDVLLMLNVGGRKHTRAHIEKLIRQAGFHTVQVYPTASSLYVFRIDPADGPS